MPQIAEGTGVTLAVLRRHFDNKASECGCPKHTITRDEIQTIDMWPRRAAYVQLSIGGTIRGTGLCPVGNDHASDIIRDCGLLHRQSGALTEHSPAEL